MTMASLECTTTVTPITGRRTKSGAQAVEIRNVERTKVVQRYVAVGTVAWAGFVVTDLVAARVNDSSLLYLLALRFAGVVIGVGLYFALDTVTLGPRQLEHFESALNPLAALFISLAAARCGGLTSPLALGVAISTMMRSLLPSPWHRALAGTLPSALLFPAVMLAASRWSPTIALQLETPVAVWTFLQNTVFLVLAAALAAGGSHLLWSAKEEIHNARTFGNYRLVARIGSGGMGDVWLARQMPLDRRVALKILKPGTMRDPGAIRRFKREAEAASSLTHPNTIRIYDYGASEEGISFIAMELLDGMDFELLVERLGPLPPARAVHLALQICESLAEAHRRGIVHCDLKPANLFVTKMGDEYDFAKVLDFGLARAQSASEHTTQDVVLGTPAYMPPEILRGERPVPQSDVYAMGAVLYWLLTGSTVFVTRRVQEFVLAHLERVPERPSTRLGRDLPADLEAVVLTCLAKEPAERYVDAGDLAEALSRCKCAGTWPAAAARGAWDPIRPSLRRLRSA
jgi:serine/threonine-protein kinase